MTHITVNGLKIHYQKHGKGYPLVLIPGIYCDSRTYKKIIPLLAEKYTVFIPDMPCHGKSDKYKKVMSLKDFSSELNKMINCWKIKKPILMAHSAGCALAIQYALDHPVKELVIAAPAGLIKMKSIMQILFELSIKKMIFALIKGKSNTFWVLKIGIENFLKNLFNKWFWKTLAKNYDIDFSKEIKRIKTPITIIAADKDELFKFKIIKKIAKNINAKLIKVNGPHDWPITKPREIKKWMK